MLEIIGAVILCAVTWTVLDIFVDYELARIEESYKD
jgi:hypothetical protein